MACENPRKKIKPLHYISSYVDGTLAVKAVKMDMSNEYKRMRREKVLSGVKDVYDRGFANQDRDDKAASYIRPTTRNQCFERALLMGIFFVLLASNCRLLYDYGVHESDDFVSDSGRRATNREFATEVAFSLAGYDPSAGHDRVKVRMGRCAVCAWWQKHHARNGGADFETHNTRDKCARCRVRVCRDCWGHRHYVHFAELDK